MVAHSTSYRNIFLYKQQRLILKIKIKKKHLKTIASDSGKEFANHQQISEALGIDFYFAKPYHGWERGSNENLNDPAVYT